MTEWLNWTELVYSCFLIHPNSVLRNCILLGIYPFLLCCQFYLLIIVYGNLLWSHVLLWCFFLWFLLFHWFWPSFIWWVWIKVYQFILCFQRMSSQFHWYFLLFLVSISFLSVLIFMISLLLTLCFVCSFSGSSRCKVMLFILYIFLFSEVGFYCYKLPC